MLITSKLVASQGDETFHCPAKDLQNFAVPCDFTLNGPFSLLPQQISLLKVVRFSDHDLHHIAVSPDSCCLLYLGSKSGKFSMWIGTYPFLLVCALLSDIFLIDARVWSASRLASSVSCPDAGQSHVHVHVHPTDYRVTSYYNPLNPHNGIRRRAPYIPLYFNLEMGWDMLQNALWVVKSEQMAPKTGPL